MTCRRAVIHDEARASFSEDSEWHQRLGHLSLEDVRWTVNGPEVSPNAFPIEEYVFCDELAWGKPKTFPRRNGCSPRDTRVFYHFSCDVHGPMV